MAASAVLAVVPAYSSPQPATTKLDSVAAVARLAARFDLSRLPPERPPDPPPVDPTAALRKFTLLGVVQSDEKSVALFSDGSGGQQILNVGDALAGFTLTSVEPRKAFFAQGAIIVDLDLAQQASSPDMHSQVTDKGNHPQIQ